MSSDTSHALPAPLVKVKNQTDINHNHSNLLDYRKVRQYWNGVKPSVLGPYMMDNFGFPTGAGFFRFREECKIVSGFLSQYDQSSSILDLGSGVGYWSEFFSSRFSKVISVESSDSLYRTLSDRLSKNSKINTIHCDVIQFNTAEKFDVVFLGGLLMYLNEPEVTLLLNKISTFLKPGGIVICRESTVQAGVTACLDKYQVVYRPVEKYRSLFLNSKYRIEKIIPNKPYILLQMPCELLKKWKSFVPKSIWGLFLLGPLLYWMSRLTYALTSRVNFRTINNLGWYFPKLKNHFFIVKKYD